MKQPGRTAKFLEIMAHVKAGGTTHNLRDSAPKYRGIKIHDGQTAKAGSIIVRQKGVKIMAGKNAKMGKDCTIFSLKEGVVKFTDVRKVSYDGNVKRKKVASVL